MHHCLIPLALVNMMYYENLDDILSCVCTYAFLKCDI